MIEAAATPLKWEKRRKNTNWPIVWFSRLGERTATISNTDVDFYLRFRVCSQCANRLCTLIGYASNQGRARSNEGVRRRWTLSVTSLRWRTRWRGALLRVQKCCVCCWSSQASTDTVNEKILLTFDSIKTLCFMKLEKKSISSVGSSLAIYF